MDRAIQEKQQKIVHAEGEAEAAKLISFFIQRFILLYVYLRENFVGRSWTAEIVNDEKISWLFRYSP